MPQGELIIYATAWCGDCRRIRVLLDARNFPYQWIDIDYNKGAEEKVLQINRGLRSVPTIFFPDGTILVEPSNAKFLEKLESLYVREDSDR